ncbi:MAG: YicC family protein [Treponema sp.]|nr:YicC family protein [Treponema sp.]
MKSMTGYAYSEKSADNKVVSVEIKGYNSRFLDLAVYLPPWLSALEPEIRSYMVSRFNRGKIDISIRIKELNSDIKVSVNTAAAKAYYSAIEELAASLGIPQKPELSLILNLDGVLDADKNRDNEKYRAIIEPVLGEAADRFEAERSREGRDTLEDILSHTAILENSAKVIEAYVPELENSIKENLRARFAEVLGNEIDENRVLAETAVLLMKYTISEELSRLASHLAEFRSEAVNNPAPGKKLDFLCQEINREINTIGSKTPVLEVSRLVVEMKNALENIREQLRNVE